MTIGYTSHVDKPLAYAVCGTCGMPGKECGTDDAAHAWAIREGWEARDIVMSTGTITVYTCPDCLSGEEE